MPFSIFGRTQRAAPHVIQRADAARDLHHYHKAARLYRRALRIAPGNAAIHIQCGHMLKESGNLTAAERHYLEAAKLTPDDPDLALQIGHLYKRAGRLSECEQAYRKALELWPEWPEPARELADLYRRGWRSVTKTFRKPVDASLQLRSSSGGSIFEEAPLAALPSTGGVLAPELVPRPPNELLHLHGERFEIRRLGRDERTHWGTMLTLRGLEAIRGFCVSSVPIVEIQLFLNGITLHQGPVKGPYTLKFEIDRERFKKYVFNVWVDFSRFEAGKYNVDIRLIDAVQGMRTQGRDVVIGSPLREADYPSSDALIETASLSPQLPLMDQINKRRSIVRPARRSLFATPPKTILVLRTDQLGDMVCSIPALRRLRQIFPEARVIGLLTSGNIDFARTLGVFDETLLIDFPDDIVQRRRTMALPEQDALRKKLAPYNFDLAIDLAESAVSRPILLLSGAPVLFGFRDHEFPYLTAGYQGDSHDPLNRMEMTPHSAKVLALVERLGTLANTNDRFVRRADLNPGCLANYKLTRSDKFIVMHTGARIDYSRWPYFNDLVRMFLEKTTLKIVMMANEPDVRSGLPPEFLQGDRFQLLDGLLPFDDFDALLSFCSAFVGNDSGPKHLASLRGSNVVSIHMARNNWSEWGQEHSGLIISRKLPCSGCGLFYDPEECGADFACIKHISPDEVFNAVISLISSKSQ